MRPRAIDIRCVTHVRDQSCVLYVCVCSCETTMSMCKKRASVWSYWSRAIAAFTFDAFFRSSSHCSGFREIPGEGGTKIKDRRRVSV